MSSFISNLFRSNLFSTSKCNCLFTFFKSYKSFLIIHKPTSSNKNVDVVVSGNGMTTAALQFTYDAANTPVVNSITPSVLSVLGGETITITGSNLPTQALETLRTVSFGKQECDILSSTSQTLVIKSPALPPSLYDLKIPVQSLGNAKYIINAFFDSINSG